MSIQIKKLGLIEWLAGIKDETTTNMLDSLRKKISKSDDLLTKPMSIDELLKELKISDADFKTGNTLSIEELEKEMKNW